MTENTTPSVGVIRVGDDACQDLSVRGVNKRFTARPETFYVV